jgi:hypothetical protein
MYVENGCILHYGGIYGRVLMTEHDGSWEDFLPCIRKRHRMAIKLITVIAEQSRMGFVGVTRVTNHGNSSSPDGRFD